MEMSNYILNSNNQPVTYKCIICDSARGDYGKTSTLKEVNKLFNSVTAPHSQYSNINPLPKGDEEGTFLIDGVKIFVATEGDTVDVINNNLNSSQSITINGVQCVADVIIMASRSKGQSVQDITQFASQHQYDLIWFRNFHFENFHNNTNLIETSAEAIISLVKRLYP